MAKQSGLGDNFYLGGYDLSGDVSAIDKISGGPALLEFTTVSKFAHVRQGGKRDGSISFTTFFDYTGTTNAPAVPGSGTPLVSTLNWAVLVTITGGTMSNVVINGTSVGAGAGTYVLPALGTITLTYTVAPTWTWIAIGAAHNALKVPIPNTDLIASYFRGTVIGSPAAGMVSKQTNYDPTRDNDGNLTLKVDLLANGFGVEWGEQLTAGLRADTAPTVGPVRDDGASSNFGAQAYLQLAELVGTNVDVAITHSTTSGGAYTSLIDFGSLTSAPQALRGFVSNSTTVNEFIKVATTGTFTYAQFSVIFVRNLIAGQVF